MQKQIERLFELAEQMKTAAIKAYPRSCGWEDVDTDTAIYFANGYSTFHVDINKSKCKIELPLYLNRISIPRGATDEILETAAQNFEKAIYKVEQMPKRDAELDKQKEKERLKKQLEDLENDN